MKGIPADAMVELTPELIGEGEMMRELTDALRDAHAIMARRAEKGDFSGKAGVVLEIGMKRVKGAEDHMEVSFVVLVKRPKNVKATLVKERQGKLLCPLDGSSGENPDQMRMFDGKGRPLGTLDKATGEIKETETVVGKIG
jgi:hypothetical protein